MYSFTTNEGTSEAVFSIYKDFDAWWNEGRDNATLRGMGKSLGADWFTPRVADCKNGVSPETDVLVFTSNSYGDYSTRNAQNSAECQASLTEYLGGGDTLIVDMGDNDPGGGFKAPGATGTPTNVYPSNEADATLSPAAKGIDGVVGTPDDHPLVKGPDKVAGTSDDLTDSNIDACCYVAHGNLEDGIKLPDNATTLVTANFGGVQKPIVAEYDYLGGRVILDTTTKEFYGQQPRGYGVPYFMRNLFEYAESLAVVEDPVQDAEVPLIFVPGIGGSEILDLQGNEKWPRGQDVWESEEDEFLLDLSLDENGNEVIQTEPGDITRTIEADVPLTFWDNPDIYETTIKTLQSAGYEEGKNLFVFPYDLRKDVEAQGQNELITKIDDVLGKTGASKVDIMAHSQGGLVTLAALRDQDSVGKVRKVRTLGTPLLGATRALGLQAYGEGCFGKDVPFKGCVINPAVTQQMMKYMPGANQLLPSRKFDQEVGAPLEVDLGEEGDGPKSYDEWTAEVSSGSNVDPGMIAQAGQFHEKYDTLELADPSVELARVVGTAYGTPTTIIKFNDCDLFFFNCEVGYRYEETEAGDGTVPQGSAGPGINYDPTDRTDTIYEEDVEHGELTKDPEVLVDAIEYFRGSGTQQTGMRFFEVANVNEEDPFEAVPRSFDGVKLESVGPVRGYVNDDSGNILGRHPDLPSVALQRIPGGFYNSISDWRSFFLNEKGSYTGKLEVIGEGSTKLAVKTYSESQMNGQAVFRVSAPVGARLQMGFATGQNLGELRLRIDEDGDGSVEREVAPDSIVTGADASETNPPETTAGFRTVAKGHASVTLSADDGPEGSGISATYYMRDDDNRSRLYTEPFTVPFGTVVRFLSVDKAGNVEKIQREVVDDAPNNLRTAEHVSDGDHLRRTIDPEGDEDWFRFEADGSSTYRAQLLGLPEDYDLELYNGSGEKMEAPYRRGKATEEIRSQLPAGRYYLRVIGFDGAWNPKLHYQLKLQTLGTTR